MCGPPLTEQQRKEVFYLLVLGQDMDMTIEESRDMVREKFGLDEGQVRQIEQEGVAAGWPPLGDSGVS
jgi:hypothetical protein